MALQPANRRVASVSSLRYQTGVATRLENLRAMAVKWKALAASSRWPSTQYEWAEAAIANLGRGAQPYVIFLHDGSRLLAVAPLARRTAGGVEVLTALDGGALGEPIDFLAVDDLWLGELCRKTVATGHPIHLDRVAAPSQLLAVLGEMARRHSAAVEQAPAAASARIDIDPLWTSPEAHLPPAWQADYVKARHAAERHGYSLFQITSPSAQNLGSLLQEMMELEFRSWRSQVGDSLMQQRDLREFLTRYAAGMCQRGDLRIGCYRVGGAPVAAVIAVQWQQMLWVLRMAFDGRFGECSPETLLMAETLRYAMAQKLQSVRFHEISAPWTDPWPKQYQNCVSVRAYPRTLGGIVAKAMMRLVPGYRRKVVRRASATEA